MRFTIQLLFTISLQQFGIGLLSYSPNLHELLQAITCKPHKPNIDALNSDTLTLRLQYEVNYSKLIPDSTTEK